MSKSKEKEIIGAVWITAGICALGFGFTAWGWILIGKGALDQIMSISVAIYETLKTAEKKKVNETDS